MNIPTRPIAYLAQTFPGLTTVYREVIALRAKGLAVHTFATWPPNTEDVSSEAKGLVEQTFYIFPVRWLSFLKSHGICLVTRPLTYFGTLAFVLSRPGQTFTKRWRTLLHFAEAVYLAAEIEKQQIGHIHVHFAGNAATLALVVNRLTGIPFSFTAHAYDIFLDQVILKEKIEAARFIVAISEYNKRFMLKYVGNPELADKIHVIHSGIPLSDFTGEAQPCPVSTEIPLIISVGRLVEKKGFAFLIQAFRQLHDRGYRVRCLIAGSGPQEEMLRRLIHELALVEWVELAGWLDQTQVRAYLAQSAIFVLPCVVADNGDQDGIPAVLMEAMAMAIPCVSTIVSGIPELIETEQSGLLVPEKDETALADALARLLDNPQFAYQLGQAGRQKVYTAFNLDIITDQLLRLLTGELTEPDKENLSTIPMLTCVQE